MPQSLSNLFVHIIFHIHHGNTQIRSEDEEALYAYIGRIIKDSDSIPILINGTSNHVHILCALSKNSSLSKLVEDIKRHSSRWLKTVSPYYTAFAWQGGYAGFSVSASKVDVVKKYIQMQKEHHKKQSFEDEYVLFLKEYGIDYNEEYLWK